MASIDVDVNNTIGLNPSVTCNRETKYAPNGKCSFEVTETGWYDVAAEETIGGETSRGGDRVNVTDAGKTKSYYVPIHLK